MNASSITANEKLQLVLGALELSLLTGFAEVDRKFQTEKQGTLLYVVDTDVFLQFANPKLTCSYLWLSGLLAGDAAMDARLGLGEILGRFIFSKKFAPLPRFILRQIDDELDDVEDFSKTHAFDALSALQDGVAKGHNKFRGLLERFLKDKSKTAEQFVAAAAADLETTVSVLYGNYNPLRQYRRLAQLLGPRRIGDIALLDKVGEFATVLEKERVSNQGEKNLAHWIACFNKTSPPRALDDSSERQQKRKNRLQNDAEIAWAIETINQWLETQGRNVRIAWITNTSRVYQAARFKYRLELPYFGDVSPEIRSHLGRIDYLSQVDPNAAYSEKNKQVYRHLLLRDSRSLITLPEFLEFGKSQSTTKSDDDVDVTRSISEWLPVLLPEELRHWEKVSFTWRKLRVSGPAEMSAVMSDEALSALQEEFSTFLRETTLRGAFERGLRHKVMADLGSVFRGEDADDVIVRRIDQTLAELLDEIAFDGIEASSKDSQGAGWVPPIVVTSFGITEKTLAGIVRKLQTDNWDTQKIANEVKDELVSLSQSKFGCEGLDAESVTYRYLSLLSRAMMFGVLGNWVASKVLSKQAYLIAAHDAMRRNRKGAAAVAASANGTIGLDSRIYGREAAYWAAISARRSMGHSPAYRSQEARQYLDALEVVLKKHETPYLESCGRGDELVVHFSRLKSERLVLDLTLFLYARWCKDILYDAEQVMDYSEAELRCEFSELLFELDGYVIPADSRVAPGLIDAFWYVKRQVAASLLLLYLLNEQPVDDAFVLAQKFLVADSKARPTDQQGCYPLEKIRPSLFDCSVLEASIRYAAKDHPITQNTELILDLDRRISTPMPGSYPFETKRFEFLKNLILSS